MCTLVLIHRRVLGSPLVIAANRDEYLDRPSEGPAVRETESGPILAPRDLRAGGTWLGLNAGGLFAAVTNRCAARPDPNRRSRGLLVEDALRFASADRAADHLSRIPAGSHNPCNVIVADRKRAFAVMVDDAPRVREFEPGAHVIGNADPDDRSIPKLARVLERAERAANQPRQALFPALRDLCRDHRSDGDALGANCVHTPGYGTRSSAVLILAEREAESCFWWATGPPCETEYQDFTSLLPGLRRSARVCEGEAITRAAS